MATASKTVRPRPAAPVKTYAVYTRCDRCGIYDRDPRWCDLCGKPKDLSSPQRRGGPARDRSANLN